MSIFNQQMIFNYPTTYPIFAASATTVGASVTSHTINLPAGIVAGNALFIFVCIGYSTAAGTISTPGGWTAIGTTPDSVRVQAFQRVADGTEGSTVTITTATAKPMMGVSILVTGANATTPVDTFAWGTVVAGKRTTSSISTNVMTIGTQVSGTVAVGDVLGGTGIPGGITVLNYITGSGAAGSTLTLSSSVGTIASEEIDSIVPSIIAPTVTPTDTRRLLITVYFACAAGAGSGISPPISITFDASETKVAEASGTLGGDGCVSLGRKNLSSKSATGTLTGTTNWGNFETVAMSLLIKR